MKTQLTLTKVSHLLLGGLMALSMACVNQVETPDDNGGSGSGGAGGDSTTSGSDGGAGGAGGDSTSSVGGGGSGGALPTADGIAIRVGDIPSTSTTTSGSSTVAASTGGGPGQDPDTLRLVLGDEMPSCLAPTVGTDCGGHWRISIKVPPSMQQPGIYTLADLNGFFSVSGELEPGGICSGGGGSFWDGTMEIVSIDENGLNVVLSNTATFDFDANGSHYLARCPSTP